jgi:hypothetical protein
MAKIKYKEPIEVDFWAERDRASIVISDDNGKIIAEWWDEEVVEMIEQGLFEWENARSVIQYLADLGILKSKKGYLPKFYQT